MRRRIVYTLVFFLAYFVLSTIDFYNEEGNFDGVWVSLLVAASTSVAIFINIFWLMPKLFFNKKYWAYFPLVLLLSVATLQIEEVLFVDYFNEEELYFDWLGVIFNLIIIGGVSAMIEMINLFEYKQRVAELEKEQLETQMQMLKAQLAPHFLFNTLNNLYFLIQENQEEASGMLIRFSNLLRHILYESNEERVSLKKEVDHIKEYLSLEEFRFGDTIEINNKMKLVGENVMLAPFMLWPFLENAFKYTDSSVKGQVDIVLTFEKNVLTYEVTNFPIKKNSEKSGGLGLTNLKKRLEIEYSNNHKCHWGIDNNTYKAFLEIEL